VEFRKIKTLRGSERPLHEPLALTNHLRNFYFLWPPYVIVADIIFFPCDFYILFFFFPRLISAGGDWMSTILPHMVWP